MHKFDAFSLLPHFLVHVLVSECQSLCSTLLPVKYSPLILWRAIPMQKGLHAFLDRTMRLEISKTNTLASPVPFYAKIPPFLSYILCQIVRIYSRRVESKLILVFFGFLGWDKENSNCYERFPVGPVVTPEQKINPTTQPLVREVLISASPCSQFLPVSEAHARQFVQFSFVSGFGISRSTDVALAICFYISFAPSPLSSTRSAPLFSPFTTISFTPLNNRMCIGVAF